MKDMRHLKVGSTFIGVQRADRFREGDKDGNVKEFTVTRLGRKYIYAVSGPGRSEVRFNADSCTEDSGWRPFMAFESLEDYALVQAREIRERACQRLMSSFTAKRWKKITSDELDTLEVILEKLNG